MQCVIPPLRSWLYAPGNQPRLLDKVFDAGADAVVLDLEDAVPLAEKERARQLVAEVVRSRRGRPRPVVFVRINHPLSGLADADVAAVVEPGLAGLRLPKTERVEDVAAVARLVADAEHRKELPNDTIAFVCNLESAAGVVRAAQIAAASQRVYALAFGAVDFARDVGATVGPEGLETLHARSQLVLASRVAGIRPPVESVYPRLQDEEGLERATRQSRALGFFGRAAIHPRQVPIINAVFTPSHEEVERAREIVAAATQAEASGVGALKLPNGDFVDVAVVRRAEDVLALAASLSEP
jgi:citrate lyase subunit beta/citryl-CoA lyase